MPNHLPSDEELRVAVEEANAAAEAAERAAAERREEARFAGGGAGSEGGSGGGPGTGGYGENDDEANEADVPVDLAPAADEGPTSSEPTGEVVYPARADADVEPEPNGRNTQDLAVELEETRNRLLRSAADFDNYRKRVQREREETIQYANEAILRDLLPVLDNLERAVDAGRSNRESDTLYEGVRMVVQQFHALLDQYGVRRVPGVGEAFDPAWHEAMQQMPSSDFPPGSVMEELQPGYMYRERLLRPALVIVSSRAPAASTQATATVADEDEFDDIATAESGEMEAFEEDTLPETSLPGFGEEE